MELLYREEHRACFNYKEGERPAIELKKLNREYRYDEYSRYCKIVFPLDGNLDYSSGLSENTTVSPGHILLLPPGKYFAISSISEVRILVIRLTYPVNFCECYLLESLTHQTRHTAVVLEKSEKEPYLLDTNQAVDIYTQGLSLCLESGLKCKCYFETKIKELFYLFRAYYVKEELAFFFHEILNTDSSFFYFVRINYKKYKTASEFASALNMTLQSFEKHFKAVFGVPVYKWMTEQKVNEVKLAICTEQTPFKELAARFGFATKSSFHDFCVKNLGSTPGKIRENLRLGLNDVQKQ
jgi:AraC-like DNA-binding protein